MAVSTGERTLVSSPYERASLIVTSNKPFGRWGEAFGDDVVAAAMIGDSYRLKDRDLGAVNADSNGASCAD